MEVEKDIHKGGGPGLHANQGHGDYSISASQVRPEALLRPDVFGPLCFRILLNSVFVGTAVPRLASEKPLFGVGVSLGASALRLSC